MILQVLFISMLIMFSFLGGSATGMYFTFKILERFEDKIKNIDLK